MTAACGWSSTAGRLGLPPRVPRGAGGPAPSSPALLKRHCYCRQAASQRAIRAAATALKPLTEEAAAAAAEQDGWRQSRELLVARLGLSHDEADSTLQEAFGWGSQAYWRQTKVQEPPSAEQVAQVRACGGRRCLPGVC